MVLVIVVVFVIVMRGGVHFLWGLFPKNLQYSSFTVINGFLRIFKTFLKNMIETNV